MLLKVEPLKAYHGVFTVPSSKPETQRAIIMACLADGVSYIHDDLRCSETDIIKTGFRNLGARIIEHEDHLEIHGLGSRIDYRQRTLDCKGSGLALRIFTALTSTAEQAAVITGNDVLCNRVITPMIEALRQLGARLELLHDGSKPPVLNWGGGLAGGVCTLPGNVSSQFITAILVAAPLARQPVEIRIDGEVFSLSYIKQTIAFMTMAGIRLDVAPDFRTIKVHPGPYRSGSYHIKEDYTSASYLLACAALFKGRTVLRKVHGSSQQGERAIIKVLENLGIQVTHDPERHELIVDNPWDRLEGHFEFHAMDYPNIVPTLAAIGAYVHGTFRVTGASITRFHKASRVEAIASELGRLGVDIKVLEQDGVCDGFEIHGKSRYPGGKVLSSWGDHRIFMSLFMAALRTEAPCAFGDYQDVHCSFPSFFSEFRKAGVTMSEVGALDVQEAQAETRLPQRPRALSLQELRFYRENGYLVVKNLFGAEQIQQADQAIQEILAGNEREDVAELEPRDPAVIRRIWAPTKRHPCFMALASSPALLDRVEDLIGPDVVFQYSKLNMKGPRVGSVVEWHQDLSYYPHTNTDLVACLVHLDDATVANGCLRVIPGSHRWGLLNHFIDGHFRGKLDPAALGGRLDQAVALEAPAGSVVFIHCLTIHGSEENRSGLARRAFLPAYRAADAFPIHYGPHAAHNEADAVLLRGRRSDRARLEAGSQLLPLAEKQFGSLFAVQEGSHLAGKAGTLGRAGY